MGAVTVNLRSNPCLRAMSGVLRDHGIPYSIRHGGKHPHIVFKVGERCFERAIPASPSDYRSALNARAQMRRLMKDMAHG